MAKSPLAALVRRKPHELHHVHKPGTAPGTLAAHQDAQPTAMYVMAFDKGEVIEHPLEDLSDIPALRKKWGHVWVNVDGLADIARLEELGRLFNIHPLALEDVVNVHQRPKTEDFEDHMYVVTRQAQVHTNGQRLYMEQVSLFVGKGYVLTFQERPGDCLDPVRDRIRKGQSRLHTFGTDYLAYAILDAIIDGYFPVLDMYSQLLDSIEDTILAEPESTTMGHIHGLKRELMTLRRATWPLREAVGTLMRDGDRIFSDQTDLYLRDCQDHVSRILDILESYHEQAASLTELYLSSLSNKMNEVMKVLTIIATIFMPLGFVAGIYGMNFNPEVSHWNMPETQWAWGYPFALAMMFSIAILFTYYFFRKGWIGHKK
ncbi:MAG: magnesium/cobalt transporter CorA [Proteobacteria bacterium]|nr:magnesium/cobalt transporter CorA [Pseudomonadota bacterium]